MLRRNTPHGWSCCPVNRRGCINCYSRAPPTNCGAPCGNAPSARCWPTIGRRARSSPKPSGPIWSVPLRPLRPRSCYTFTSTRCVTVLRVPENSSVSIYPNSPTRWTSTWRYAAKGTDWPRVPRGHRGTAPARPLRGHRIRRPARNELCVHLFVLQIPADQHQFATTLRVCPAVTGAQLEEFVHPLQYVLPRIATHRDNPLDPVQVGTSRVDELGEPLPESLVVQLTGNFNRDRVQFRIVAEILLVQPSGFRGHGAIQIERTDSENVVQVHPGIARRHELRGR